MLWEYYVDYHGAGHGMEKLEKTLNELGQEGWELVAVTRVDNSFNVFLKRPKKNSN